MRTGISIEVAAVDRVRMEAIVADRGSSQNHVWRCRIVLLTAAGLGTNAIMREAGVAKTAVWRWQERFMQEGVDGLLRDKTRPPGKLPAADRRRRQDRQADADRAPSAVHPTMLRMAWPLASFARRDDALDGARHGASDRHQRLLGPAHLEGAWAGTAPLPPLQTVE